MKTLDQKERMFAEENHNLIYTFLNLRRLPEAEYYDLCAIAYLNAVMDYHRKPGLKEKYRFLTIAFKKMDCARANQYRSDRSKKRGAAYSLNELGPDELEYIYCIPDPHDYIAQYEDVQNARTMASAIMDILDARQKVYLKHMIKGGGYKEIKQEMHISNDTYCQGKKDVRAAAAAVIAKINYGGGYLMHGQAGYY